MRAGIEFFRNNLKPDSGIEWEMSIAHLIPQTPFATMIGDSSLEGAGTFSIALGFWWHICFPGEIIQRTLLFNSRGCTREFSCAKAKKVLVPCTQEKIKSNKVKIK